ncbi:MAG: serine/threonine-protein kinase [Myxococcota bacterium]
MELLAGESLARVVLARGRLPWSDVAAIALQICDALGAAHEIGVVHRDVKPANIFAIERDDGQWHCTLLDFGLCKPTAATETQLTAAGVFLGTPGYVAPEQIRGEFVDGRADIYGLGCVMAELLTGRPAFSGADRQAVVASQLRGWAPADVPPELEPLLRRALALNPQDRYPDVATFQRAIAGVGGNRPRARVEPSGLRRGYLLGVGTTVLCAAALALVGRSCVERRAAPVEPPTARPAPPPQSPAPPVPERVAEPSPPPRLAAAPPVEEAPPEPKPAPRPRPKRTRRAQPKRPPPAPPAPERAAFADGIRDPFAGL